MIDDNIRCDIMICIAERVWQRVPEQPDDLRMTSVARRDAEGFFTIAGRRKDMLISGGVNVYPAEIEGELLLHPAVQDAAVVGVPDPTWGEVGVAFVVPRPGLPPTKEELLAFAGARLARYKLPKEFVFVDTVVRSPAGKADYRWAKETATKPT